MKNRKQANIDGELSEKRVILYTSAKLEVAHILRNLDASKDPAHDVVEDDDLKGVPILVKIF